MRRTNNRLITLGMLLIVAVLLIVLGAQSGALRPVVSVILTPIRPIARLLNAGTLAAGNLTTSQEDYNTLSAHARDLERTVAQMQVEIVQLREIERDYYRLADLVDYAAVHPDQNLVTANVIASDTSGYLRWIIINRGTRDGIQVGNPVINELGLVGRVEDVAANAAWVRLIIDSDSTVDARLQTTRAEGTITGQLQGGLRMEYIPRDAVVNVGDLVVTSGLGGTFPANMVIGQVTSVRSQQADIHQQAEVRPTVNFDDLEIVSVVTSFEPVDLSIFNNDTGGQATPAP